jgi:hypothetical protein
MATAAVARSRILFDRIGERAEKDLLGEMADGFYVVAVGVSDECAIVVRVVLGPQAGFMENLSTTVDSGAEEAVDGRTGRGAEGNV